jgi:hypothetical protein
MTFGEAIEALKQKKCVGRKGWNGKKMYLYLEDFSPPEPTQYEPCIVMYTAQGKYQPGWLASQADMLATDWVLVGELVKRKSGRKLPRPARCRMCGRVSAERPCRCERRRSR